MRSKIRLGLSIIAGIVVLPVFGEFFVRFAESQGFYDDPSALGRAAMSFLRMITDSDLFWLGWPFLVGVALGMWIDKLLTPKDAWTTDARLSLAFDSRCEAVTPIVQENVRFYYWLILAQENTKGVSDKAVYVFLSLKDPTHTNYNSARIHGGGIRCTVISTHSAGAVVQIAGNPAGRTVEIRFSKYPIPLES